MRAASTFARTSEMAVSRFVPSSNSKPTLDIFSSELEVTFLIPFTEPTASSIGLEICVSTSCGPAPG